jgi:hypothetical protein
LKTRAEGTGVSLLGLEDLADAGCVIAIEATALGTVVAVPTILSAFVSFPTRAMAGMSAAAFDVALLVAAYTVVG